MDNDNDLLSPFLKNGPGLWHSDAHVQRCQAIFQASAPKPETWINPPPPAAPVVTDRSSDDEGYQSADSDFDEPPPLIQDEYPTSHHSQLSHIHRDQPVLLSARLAAQARAGVSVNAASTADGTSDHEDADFFRPPARLFTKEPHSGGCAPACRCYCNCSICLTCDAGAAETAWALGLPLPAHAPFIITVGGVRRRLCPCPVASHRWFHRVSGEMSGEIDREPRSDGERVERKWVVYREMRPGARRDQI
ncbi:hypothetical protein B0H13DRAFT_2331755 [Mycena leptocephala]|nr:hypothetical protein B0H13DRAFT_2331755 [Mycena leptocephala]